MGNDSNMWAWKSSFGEYHRLDYMIHSKSLRSEDIPSNVELNIGSNHSNVSISIEFMRSQQHWIFRKRTFK